MQEICNVKQHCCAEKLCIIVKATYHRDRVENKSLYPGCHQISLWPVLWRKQSFGLLLEPHYCGVLLGIAEKAVKNVHRSD